MAMQSRGREDCSLRYKQPSGLGAIAGSDHPSVAVCPHASGLDASGQSRHQVSRD